MSISESNNYPQDIPPPKLPARTKPRPGGKMIRWENGIPVPEYREPISLPAIKELMQAVGACDFEGDYNFEEGRHIVPSELEGLSNMEVAVHRLWASAAGGNQKALEMLLDRLIGKPKLSVETTNMSITYQDFLDSIGPGAQTIDVTPGKGEYVEPQQTKQTAEYNTNVDPSVNDFFAKAAKYESPDERARRLLDEL